jgi:hypothetical protein
MKKNLLRSILASTALALPACGPSDGNGDEGAENGTTGSGEDGTTADDGSSGNGGTGTDAATSSDSSDTGDGGVFIELLDGGDSSIECDPWAQDCPEGEKCAWWAEEGEIPWDTKCTPLAPDPKQPGDTCTTEDHMVSGIDDCDVGSACYYWVDLETLQGVCVPFCTGSPDDPTCEDPNATCMVLNGGAVILCLPSCDPLLQDCPGGQACYLAFEEFVCMTDVSGPDKGAYGDPCMIIDACNPGLHCALADYVPGCEGSGGCCSPYCDTTAPNNCPGMTEGEECVPIWAEGEGPPEYEHVGVCMLPGM